MLLVLASVSLDNDTPEARQCKFVSRITDTCHDLKVHNKQSAKFNNTASIEDFKATRLHIRMRLLFL